MEGPVQAVRAFHISEGTIFNYCKIQVSNRPKNTLRKIYWVGTVGKRIVCSYALDRRIASPLKDNKRLILGLGGAPVIFLSLVMLINFALVNGKLSFLECTKQKTF